MNVKVYIAVYAILTIGADDLLVDVPEMRTFALKFGKAEPQGHPHLDCLARHLTIETPKYFGDSGTNIIIGSTLDAINGLALEAAFPGGFPKATAGFSLWMRVENGYVQIVPNLRDIICYVNDIISFYKERVLAKENSLISNLAQEKTELFGGR
ncbi:trichodiene synthase [Hirsutella rhossiliensis]|uniref:Trichodiene synthase n=1 Tax=Hirsutella rhossiliensis TaxID=111463 RepID=A0A9P8SH12_9HYPO|nr:trichodiene synthase [Hirsutella rhossiliensis]KAH0961055.1 trichodiene synthase [Hirsutella rhossiliensis]